MIDVSDDSEVQSHTIDNDGDIQWGGSLRGHIGQFLNQGGVLIKGDTHLTGTSLFNSKAFKALGIFDWVGETFQNSGKGKMALFDNRVVATRQVINEGLLLWTHNTFRTWHFLNLGWAEMTKDLTAGLPATFKAPTDKSTTFKKSMVENRGVLKIAPKDYKPRMTLEHSGDFAHWLNKGDIVLPETHLQAKTLRNEGTFVVEGNLTGRVESFENTKTLGNRKG
jgi:adhesin HecA-like repeat protein